MIELKVAAKEMVKITFGGSHGFEPQVFHFDAESMGYLTQKTNDLIKERDNLLRQLGVEAESSAKLKAMLEAHQVGTLRHEKSCPVCEIEDRMGEARFTQSHPIQCIDNWFRKQKEWDALTMKLGKEIERLKSEHWQPIETAPKDGTEILVWSNRGGVSCSKFRNQTWIFPGGFPGVQPTHWQPIPPTP